MPTKKHYTRKRNTIRRTKRRTTRKYTKTTNINWNGLLGLGKAVGGTLFKTAKLAGNVVGAVVPQLQMIPMVLNNMATVKKSLDTILGKDEEEAEEQEENLVRTIKRMKIAIIKLSKVMVSKYPRMREHPLYIEMTKLYDDIEFIEQFQNSWDKMEQQKQIFPIIQRFKQILMEYKKVMNQE